MERSYKSFVGAAVCPLAQVASAILKPMRDPLLHFILIGIAIVALHRLLRSDVQTVEITQAMVASAEADFARRTGREPEESEQAELVAQLVEDEILVREGQALSLADGDAVLRRRLITRMRLLLASTAPPLPTDDELAVLLAAHPERYTRAPAVTFRHVFLDASRHPDVSDAAQHVMAALQAGVASESLGDPFLHGRAMIAADEAAIAEKLGADFAAGVMGLPAEEWRPMRSGYGEHVVFVSHHHPAVTATLAEARTALAADWQEAARSEAAAAALAAIRAQYRVVLP